ncbi:MAG: hypothetical protein AAGD35_06580 [Actinomycetota bacterium]
MHRWIGPPDEPRALVAYAWDSNEGLVYVTHDDPVDDGEDEVVRRAFANLEEEEAAHQVVETDDSRVLVATSAFAAEKVLLERYMRTVHQALDAPTVVVSVARRGTLLACDVDAPERARTTLTQLHSESFVAAGENRITDRLVVVNDGVKQDVITVNADGSVAGW